MKTKDKIAARLTVFGAAEMTPAGRKRIADWLRQQAVFLEARGKDCAKRYTARYLY